jgi:dipeptidyl aminopeptidase/acylaminoacyl peptidase
MQRRWRWLAGFVLGLTGGACAAAPLEAYGKLPTFENGAVSPDGKLLALEMTDGDKRVVLIEDPVKKTMIGALRAGEHKVRDIQWAGSDHLIVTTSTATYIPEVTAPTTEWLVAQDYNVRTGEQTPLIKENAGNNERFHEEEKLNVISDRPQIRMIGGKPYAFLGVIQFPYEKGVLCLDKVDLSGGPSIIEADGSEFTRQWFVDPAGAPLAQGEYDHRTSTWTLRLADKGSWRTVKSVQAPIDVPGILGLGQDGRSVVVEDHEDGRPVVRLAELSASDWAAPDPALQDKDLIFDDSSGALIGTQYLEGDDYQTHFFAPADQAIWEGTLRACPGDIVRLVSMSQDHHRLLVDDDSPSLGPGYFFVDVDAKSASWIGAAYDKLDTGDVGEVRSIAFKAADGLALSGYLTLPHGKDAKNLPLIVFPHGGPAVRDIPGFDWWAQAMASRGYAVLQVNFRGSYGFGEDFLSAGYGQWGRKMQTDLSDGVRYLAGQGLIDPKRVCIVGASYGGYAALAGAALDVGVYRCAVSVAGISDLARMIRWSRGQEGVVAQRDWDRFVGASGPDDPGLAAISPVDHIDRVTIPVLLIHGKDDTVVPFEQSEIMRSALVNAGKQAQLVVLNHEDHWLSHGDTRLQMLQATMDFVEKNNPP